MSLPTFTDITKTIKDLLTKEFPGEKSKIEVTTNTANNNTFVSTLTRSWEKGDYVGAFNPKFKRPEYGLSGNVSVDTNGELKAEIAVADQLVDGLKVTVTDVIGPESKNPPVKIAAEYKSGNTATASATVELFHPTNGTTVALGVVGGHEGIEGGVEVKALAEKQELAQISAVVGYRNSEFSAHAQVTQKGEALDTKLTYLHNINSGFVVVGDVNFDAKKVMRPILPSSSVDPTNWTMFQQSRPRLTIRAFSTGVSLKPSARTSRSALVAVSMQRNSRMVVNTSLAWTSSSLLKHHHIFLFGSGL